MISTGEGSFGREGKVRNAIIWSNGPELVESKEGLQVKYLRKQNSSLLVKWWCKLENEKGLWQDIIYAKYLKKNSIAIVKEKWLS